MSSGTSTYELNGRQLAKFLLFGMIAWLPPMSGLALLARGLAPTRSAILVGIAGLIAVVGLSLWRSLSRREPVFLESFGTDSGGCRNVRKWSDVASVKGNFASRWAMYEDLTAWLSSRQWMGQVVGEVGGSNDALRGFLDGAIYRQLPYPEYDVQNLHQIRDSQFDVIILDQTLEHVADPERALREVARVLKPGAVAIVTTPFLLPVHTGPNFGDYYRWTPQGMETVLRRCGFEPQVRMWGSLKAAKALAEDIYLRADRARELGVSLTAADSDATFPVTVWAIATNLKSV